MVKKSSIITIRCTDQQKEAISNRAWEERKSVSELFQKELKRLAKPANTAKTADD